jgi:hypothetical protein
MVREIEQRLGRMLVRAVAGVDHRAVDAVGEVAGGPGRLVRMISASGRIAAMLRAVSSSVSPLVVLLVAEEMLM